MGWDEPFKASKDEVVAMIIRRYGAAGNLLAHALVGNHLWMAMKHTDGHTYVVLALLQKTPSSYAYKIMDEIMEPYYFDCPTRIVDAASENPPPTSSWRAIWQKVNQERRAERRRSKSEAYPGRIVTLENKRYRLGASLGRKGWIVECLDDGGTYRMLARHLAQALRAEAATQRADPPQAVAA